MSAINPKDCFLQTKVADLRLICCPGAEELTSLIDNHLVRWANEAGIDKETFIIPAECPRFQSGDAKGLVKESVRGDDIYIVVDPGNYSVTYNLFGYENHLSPDDHFANLKRLIQAVAGKAHRVSVIMPSLYGGRQGAMNRNMYFSSVLGCNLGMFYKRRDYTRVVNGRNPIVAHEYLGDSVEGKTVFIADDIIASGESMLEVASNLKTRGAKRIIADATFPLFTSGLDKFDKAVEEGTLDYVVGTNLTYRKPELLNRDWYVDVDVSKYAAYFIVALNHDMSVSSIIDPIKKIEALLASRK